MKKIVFLFVLLSLCQHSFARSCITVNSNAVRRLSGGICKLLVDARGAFGLQSTSQQITAVTAFGSYETLASGLWSRCSYADQKEQLIRFFRRRLSRKCHRGFLYEYFSPRATNQYFYQGAWR